jgi:hypothetical protein
MKSLVAVFLLLFCTNSTAAESSSAGSHYLCRNQKLVRTLRVVEKPDKCVTIYTKAGTDRVVGTGIYLQSCISILQNIKGNLEEASWKCRDISQSEVVQSYEVKE